MIKNPDYIKNLPDDARLSKKELLVVTGYKSIASLKHAIKMGIVPKADYMNGYRPNWVLSFWKVKTIREWIEKKG